MNTYTFAQITIPKATQGLRITGINNHDQISGEANTNTSDPTGFTDSRDHISYLTPSQVTMGSMNDQGWSVGTSGHYAATERGFIHKGNTYTTINSTSDSFTHAEGINNTGTVVGNYYNTQTGMDEGFVRDPNGTMTDVIYPGAISTDARAINNLGNDIAGTYRTSDNVDHGFVDVAGIIQALNVPGASSTQANGVNNFGDVVGDYVGADLRTHGFLYNPANQGYSEIDAPGSNNTFIYAVNDLGDIAGSYGTAAGSPLSGFIATLGHQPPIGTVTGQGSDVFLGPAAQNIAYGGGTIGFGSVVVNTDLIHTAAMNILVPQPTL